LIWVDENHNKSLKEQQTDHAAMNEILDKTVLLETERAEAIEAKSSTPEVKYILFASSHYTDFMVVEMLSSNKQLWDECDGMFPCSGVL
jgi:hypothetical protein